MFNTLGAIATIMSFIIYVFIEWPKIQRRLKESYPLFEKFLIILSVLGALLMIVFSILAAISFFIKSQTFVFYIFATAAMFGFSYLTDYWIENKTFAYRRASSMSSIWLLMIMSLIIGVVGVFLYTFAY